MTSGQFLVMSTKNNDLCPLVVNSIKTKFRFRHRQIYFPFLIPKSILNEYLYLLGPGLAPYTQPGRPSNSSQCDMLGNPTPKEVAELSCFSISPGSLMPPSER